MNTWCICFVFAALCSWPSPGRGADAKSSVAPVPPARVEDASPGSAQSTRLRGEYLSAREAYERLLRSFPAVMAAKMAADQADKGWSETRARENITRENAEINKELAALQAKMEEYEKAYLATNTNYARLQTALSEAGKGWWGRTNSRRAELEVRVAKLRKQTERSPQDEADLQNALAELGPLRERFRAVRKEEERISGKLGIIRYEARQTAEYKELGRQYMLLQMQKWDIGSKNEKLRSAQQATVDKKRLFEEQLAQHPELQQARQRMDEARRAYGDADWVGR